MATEQAPHALHHVTVPHPLALLWKGAVSRQADWGLMLSSCARPVFAPPPSRCKAPCHLPLCRGDIAVRQCFHHAGAAGSCTAFPSRRRLESPCPPAPPGTHPRPLPHFQSSMLLHNLSRIDFLSARKPATPCAARISHRTAPSRTQPQTHQATPCPPITARTPTHPAASLARPQPHRRKAGFPQSLHRVFHNFAGFPQRLSFPLAFFERDRVRYALPCVPTAQ